MDNLFNLPPLPEPWGSFEFQLDAEDGQLVESEDGKPVFSADQMRAYALAAVEAEREACADVCAKVYYLHVGPTFGEVRYGVAACQSAILERGKS